MYPKSWDDPASRSSCGTPTWSFRETSDEERINDSEVGLHFMEACRSDSEPDLMECCEFMTCSEITGYIRWGLITEKIHGQ